MKIKNLFITLGLAVAATAAVGVGLQFKGNVKEAKAESDTYYLTGSFNNWSTVKSECVAMVPYKTDEVKVLGYDFTGNNTFKALKFANDGDVAEWMPNITGTGGSYNQISSASGINVYAYENNASRCRNA